VARGQADGMYVNTAGIGRLLPGHDLGLARIRPGDQVLVSGTIGDHGLAVMLQREGRAVIESDLASDTAPLGGLVEHLLDGNSGVVFMRDPTRGGLAGVLAEMAARSGLGLVVEETDIPIRRESLYAAEMLGLDPLGIANEGKLVAVVRATEAEALLQRLRDHPLGRSAQRIGHFTDAHTGRCELVTDVGGRRVLLKPYGEELSRIC